MRFLIADRAPLVDPVRMLPFVERNYDILELGPRGTGVGREIPPAVRLALDTWRQREFSRFAGWESMDMAGSIR